MAADHGITLVHISSDYVFDGTAERPYREDDPVAPLGVYGQTKAAGDQIVATVPRHYVVRTSWVIGDGRNFVRTMRSLAERGVNPSVVDDQYGRLTFTSELARAIRHLHRVGCRTAATLQRDRVGGRCRGRTSRQVFRPRWPRPCTGDRRPAASTSRRRLLARSRRARATVSRPDEGAISLTVFRRCSSVGFGCRESAAEGDRERVERWLPPHHPSCPAGTGGA